VLQVLTRASTPPSGVSDRIRTRVRCCEPLRGSSQRAAGSDASLDAAERRLGSHQDQSPLLRAAARLSQRAAGSDASLDAAERRLGSHQDQSPLLRAAARLSQRAAGSEAAARDARVITRDRPWTLARADRNLFANRDRRDAARCCRGATQPRSPLEATMAKGQQSKKDTKKEPQKTLKEKRAAKAAKKAMKG
jgi:hypothetical protein